MRFRHHPLLRLTSTTRTRTRLVLDVARPSFGLKRALARIVDDAPRSSIARVDRAGRCQLCDVIHRGAALCPFEREVDEDDEDDEGGT